MSVHVITRTYKNVSGHSVARMCTNVSVHAVTCTYTNVSGHAVTRTCANDVHAVHLYKYFLQFLRQKLLQGVTQALRKHAMGKEGIRVFLRLLTKRRKSFR